MKRGFTLVEIIVSIMIFSIVVVVALSALVKVVDANKKAQTTQDAVISLSFALEAMSREMRSGSSYFCQLGSTYTFNTTLSGQSISNDCLTGISSAGGSDVLFAFLSSRTDASGNRLIYAYRIRSNGSGQWYLEKAEQNNHSDTIISSPAVPSTDSFSPIVSTTAVAITGYYLHMTNAAFPLAFIQLSGYAGTIEKDRTYFSVQTASSPRVPL